MVARLISVSEDTELSDLHDVFQQVLGWSGGLGYSFRIHGKEFNSFRGRTRSKPLREFRLHRQEKFLYICDLLDIWEWELRVMDIQEIDATDEREPVCLGGRGAAPPASCGGLRGYRLMLKRQQKGASVSDPALVEADSVAVRFASRAASQHMEFAPERRSGRVAKRRSATP